MPHEPDSEILVLGVGNANRGDDAAGLMAVRRLKESGCDASMVLEHSGEGAALLEAWKNAHAVILIDAVFSGAHPGTIHRLDASLQPLPAQIFRHSTHAFGVAEAIEVGRALHQLPGHVVVYGIEGRKFEPGAGLSHEVESAVRAVVQQVRREIHALQEPSLSGR